MKNLIMRKLISAILAILPMFTTFGQRSDIDSLLKQLNEAPNTSVKAETAIDLAQIYINIDTDSAMAFNQIAHQLATDLSDTALMIRCENTYGFIFNVNSSFEKARERFSRVLEMAISAHDSSLIASAYGNIGNTYMFEQKYSMAVESFLKALDIFEKRNNQKGIATVYGVLGNLYLSLDKLDQSLEYYQKAQSMFHTLGWADYEATALMNIGVIYKNKKDYKKALEYFSRAQKFETNQGNYYKSAQCLANIGEVEFALKNYEKSIAYQEKAFDAFEKVKAKNDAALCLMSIGCAYDSLNKSAMAKSYYAKTLSYIDSLNQPNLKMTLAGQIYSLNKKLNNFEEALKYYEIYTMWKDTILARDNQKNLAELLTKYETVQKEKEIELQKERVKRRDIILLSELLLSVLLIGLVGVLVSSYRRKKRDNEILEQSNSLISQQKEEIQTQRDEVVSQRDRIIRQNRLITDSIEYARHIQSTILPSREQLSAFFPEFFIFYLPRDIVSGDFYWFKLQENAGILAFADCTGHGVPGAFMSILGITLLDDIVTPKSSISPSQILEELRVNVKNSLKQSGKRVETKDGMDMAICRFNPASTYLEYSGANMPLTIIRNGEVLEFRPTRNPIGYYPKEMPFENHQVELRKHDMLYLFTDGFSDQLGGPNYQKYKRQNLINLLKSIAGLSMTQQENILAASHSDWKGTNEQVDDILVMGIKF